MIIQLCCIGRAIGQTTIDQLVAEIEIASPNEAREIFYEIWLLTQIPDYQDSIALKMLIDKVSLVVRNKSEEHQLHAQNLILQLEGKIEHELDISAVLDLYQLSKTKKYPLLQADIAWLLGKHLMYSSHRKQGLSYLKEALDRYKKFDMRKEMADTYYHICLIYYWLEDIEQAKAAYESLVYMGLTQLSKRHQIDAQNTSGLIAKKQKKYQKAINDFEKAVSLAKNYKDSVWIGLATGNIGDVYYEMKEYEKAKPYLNSDITYSFQFAEYNNAILSLNRLGNIARYEKNYQKAYAIFRQALAIIENKEAEFNTEYVARIYNNLAATSRLLGNHKRSYKYLEKSFTWRDSTAQITKEAEVTGMQLSFDIERKQQELETLRKEQELLKRNQHLELWTSIISVVILIGVLIYITRQYRKQKELNALLNQNNEAIKNQKEQIEYQKADLHTKNDELIKREIVFQELLDELMEDEKKIKYQNQKLRFDKEKLMDQVRQRTHELVIKNKQLLQNNAQLEQFNYVIAHNIRGPIARMLGLIQLLEASEDKDEKNLFWEKLKETTIDMDVVISDLNTTLKIKNNINEAYEKIDLPQLIQKSMASLQQQIDEANAVFELSIEVAEIKSVKAYIESVLYNLISNAIKYKDEKRPLCIKISVEQINNRTVLSITDNGLGIDLEQYHEKLFGMYKRFHLHQEGKGLGLHLVKLQVENLGGHIAVESQPNKGTTFRVYI